MGEINNDVRTQTNLPAVQPNVRACPPVVTVPAAGVPQPAAATFERVQGATPNPNAVPANPGAPTPPQPCFVTSAAGLAASRFRDRTPVEDITVTRDERGGVRAIAFRANFAVDGDGSPYVLGKSFLRQAEATLRAEHPDWPNAQVEAQARRAMRDEVVRLNHEARAQGRAVTYYADPEKLDSTSLPWNGRPVDATTVPYIALPPEIRNLSRPPVRPGDLVEVTYRGVTVYAVYEDGGPRGKAGEGSIRLAQALGIPHDPGRGGLDERHQDVRYTILPGSGAGARRGSRTFEDIQALGRNAFAAAREQGAIAPRTEGGANAQTTR